MEQLGIEPIQLLSQILNFAILAFLLNRFLYKPILSVLEKRKKKIEEGLEYTEQMKKEEEKNESKREEVISKAKYEAKKIIEDGKKTAKNTEADILEKAHKEANAILVKAREEISLEKLEMENQLKIKTVEIAKNWVESVLNKSLDTKNQMSIINRKIEEMSKLKSSTDEK